VGVGVTAQARNQDVRRRERDDYYFSPVATHGHNCQLHLNGNKFEVTYSLPPAPYYHRSFRGQGASQTLENINRKQLWKCENRVVDLAICLQRMRDVSRDGGGARGSTRWILFVA
jgi:hypothetical protein